MDKNAGDVHPQDPPVIVTLKAQYDTIDLKLNMIVLLMLLMAVWSRTDGGFEQIATGAASVLLALVIICVKPKGWTPHEAHPTRLP